MDLYELYEKIELEISESYNRTVIFTVEEALEIKANIFKLMRYNAIASGEKNY